MRSVTRPPPGRWHDPWAHYRLGAVYERLDEPARAVEEYRWALEAWAGADPEWQPLVEEIRNRLAAIGEAGGFGD